MKGFQVSFFTVEGRRHGNTPMAHWLIDLAKLLHIAGATTIVGVEGIGRHGKVHSAHFFELADQPVEVTMAVSEEQCEQLFAALERERADLFYVKTPVEYGVVGKA
jgi:PII-like signaling protein